MTCSLSVPVRRSMAHIEAVLHLHCVGKQALKTSSIKLVPLSSGQNSESTCESSDANDDSNILSLFGKMVVHGSHAMATHAGLRIHFCTACGSYGSFRSNYLKEPCIQQLRYSGKHALRLIVLGKHPGVFLKAHLQKLTCSAICPGRKSRMVSMKKKSFHRLRPGFLLPSLGQRSMVLSLT